MPQPPGFDPRESVTFVYEQMAAHLAARITGGELPPGSRLPGERAMAEEYGVSVSTVRKALGLLREQGLVVTRVPKGSFVTRPEERTSLPEG